MMQIDNLKVMSFPTRQQMGEEAAEYAAGLIRRVLKEKDEVNILFAAAPSQNEFLAALREYPIEWSRINALHMDEYLGLPEESPARFGSFLRNAIFDKVPFKAVYYLYEEGMTPEQTIARYVRLLEEHPLDIGFLGIGENGHIAFNDPHVAFFDDPLKVKIVDLDLKCRNQQVNDGCFATLADVPEQAYTVTIPVMTAIPHIVVVVPGPTKAQAVRNTLYGPVSQVCPASVLRQHPDAVLYTDAASMSLIER